MYRLPLRRCSHQGATVFELVTTIASVLPMDIDITPNDSGLPGIAQLRTIVGAVMTIGLILSVLALIISAIVWGFGSNSSNPNLASRGKPGVPIRSDERRVGKEGVRTC